MVVHFPGAPEPFLVTDTTHTTQRIPRKVLKVIRKCWGLTVVHFPGPPEPFLSLQPLYYPSNPTKSD